MLEFYDNVPELPLLASSLSDSKFAGQVQPLGVTKNAVFEVDLDTVPFEDLKGDDLGSWMATGTMKPAPGKIKQQKVVVC